MAEKNAEVPANRCGFELRPDDVRFEGSRSWWIEKTNPVCCWRPVWESHTKAERCIWHADVDEKPLVEFIAARVDAPERLDGAILRDLNIESEALSFEDCTLHGARFDNSILREVDFIGTDLRWADFTNTDLQEINFVDALFRQIDFTDAVLREANFTDTDLEAVDFTDAQLSETDFTGASLTWADFTDADLPISDFTDAQLQKIDFTNARLPGTDFTDANFQDAELSNADARYAFFRHTTLQDAVFTHADCRGSTFTSALLYETVFSGTRINSTTTFFDQGMTFYDSVTSRPGCVYEENPRTADQLPEDVQPLEAARWVYRRLETLHEENALSEEAREFHISKEEAERALYWERGEYGPWAVKTLMWYLTRHGESVKRVLTWWSGVILTAGLLFASLGGVQDADGTVYAITSLGELGTITGWQDLLMNVYFSVTTFSTIMDGGLAPAGTGTRAVVAIESIIGALLVALLIFVLGRRTAR